MELHTLTLSIRECWPICHTLTQQHPIISLGHKNSMSRTSLILSPNPRSPRGAVNAWNEPIRSLSYKTPRGSSNHASQPQIRWVLPTFVATYPCSSDALKSRTFEYRTCPPPPPTPEKEYSIPCFQSERRCFRPMP